MTWIPIVGKAFTQDTIGPEYIDLAQLPHWKPQFVVLHNTSNPTLANWHNAPGDERMKNLASYYQSLHWHAGPHFFVANDFIWAFTPIDVPGVHSPSWNHILGCGDGRRLYDGTIRRAGPGQRR
jgi:hypothetical protein